MIIQDVLQQLENSTSNERTVVTILVFISAPKTQKALKTGFHEYQPRRFRHKIEL